MLATDHWRTVKSFRWIKPAYSPTPVQLFEKFCDNLTGPCGPIMSCLSSLNENHEDFLLNVRPLYSRLCNFEVMEALKNVKDTKKKFGLRNLATITYETLQYLEESPCKYQSNKSIIDFLKEMEHYKLKANECLMMINDPPTSALHIQLLIEDSEERLTEEQVNEILQTSRKHFPGPPPENN
uniref:DNA-directed RNA polymerase III subunit RPC9 n=1 Tax=Glossina brevipalpis TaxID=37001 RepID=A0A1A9W650_9MUSC